MFAKKGYNYFVVLIFTISTFIFTSILLVVFSNPYAVNIINKTSNDISIGAKMKLTQFGSIQGNFIDYEKTRFSDIGHGELKICITSIFIDYPINITNRILNHLQYAKLYGYSYFYVDNLTHLTRDIGDFSTPKWYKPWVIFELLNSNRFDYVMWVDSDAVFMNCHISLTFIIRDVVNLLHERRYNEYIEYSMLVSPDFQRINSGVLVFKNNNWCKTFIISEWQKIYYQLEAANFPDWYPWGGDNCALGMLLAGYDPNTMNLSADSVDKYFGRVYGENIAAVKELQFSEISLRKTFQNDVGFIPQSFFNSFEHESNTHFILHCAGSEKCKNLLPQILPTSSCSKSNYYNHMHNTHFTTIDDPFFNIFCTFHAYIYIEKCIDKIFELFDAPNIDNLGVKNKMMNYHTFYDKNIIGDDLVLFILSFLATQDELNSKLIIWIIFKNTINIENIQYVLSKLIAKDCLNLKLFKIGDRIQVKVFDIDLWYEICKYYNNFNTNRIWNNVLKITDVNSNLIRFIVLWHYGGIWFDCETILFRDFSIFYDREYVYPFSYELAVSTHVLSLKKYKINATIDLLFTRILFINHKKKINITSNTFAASNLLHYINPNFQPKFHILPIYLFDPTWYKCDTSSNSYIKNQNDLQIPYWLPELKKTKNNTSDTYFMYINQKINKNDWIKINGDINNFLSYSMSNHYHNEVLKNSNITKGSWLDMYRKEYIKRMHNQFTC